MINSIVRLLSLVGLGLATLLACEEDSSIAIESKVALDKTTTSGKIGDVITANVTLKGRDVQKLVVTKSINGVPAPDFSVEIPLTAGNDSYPFSQMILAGDEEGTLVYTFSGFNGSGALIDASDLAVSVRLSGVPLLTRYDWRLAQQITGGDNTLTDAMRDNVYRLNADYSWQYDWGASGPTNFEDLNQYCAWKIIGNESQVDSIYLIKFGFLAATPTLEGYKVTKLEGEDLWLETTMDLSWLGLSAETPVIEKYIGIAKSSDFTPYRGANPADYSWGNCTPGAY